MTSGGDSVRERLHRLFLEELDERTDDLRDGLEQLAAAGSRPAGHTLEALFRAAHSLKGAAQAVGDSTVAGICHELEDLLAGIREGTRPPDATLLSRMGGSVDAIVEAGRVLRLGGPTGDADRPRPVGDDPASSSSGLADAPGGDGRPQDPVAAPGGGSVRLAPDKFDALMARAADVVSAVYRSEHVVRSVAEVRDSVSEKTRDHRSDLRDLSRLAQAARDGDRASDAVARLDRHLRDTTDELERLARMAAAQQRGLRAVVDGFDDTARHARTVPFTDATAGLARMVRELIDDTGKQAELIVDAENIEVDKTMVATLHDILGHLVRNAVDHGLEPAAERERAAKPPVGTVRVSAALVGQGIEILVEDDGKGLDSGHVRRAAQDLGLAPEEGGTLPLEELVFHPALTTTSEVTRSSGRGVGLDAVRTQVERAGGSVTLESQSGAGTLVRVIVPLTLTTVRALTVRVEDDVIAFPSSAVRTVATASAERSRMAGREVVTVGEETLAVVHAAELLGWGQGTDAEVGEQVPLLVLEAGAETVAVIVHEILAEREILMRSSPPRLAGAALLLGTTQLEDGTVGLVLSPGACVRGALTHEHVARPEDVGPSAPPQILLVEDTVTTRELQRSILELAGYVVVVAADGAQAWQLLQTHPVDAVVSDVDMPRMDGITLCRTIRASREYAQLPVILVTSLHSDADRQRGLDAGADAYLSKTGYDRGELLEALERLL